GKGSGVRRRSIGRLILLGIVAPGDRSAMSSSATKPWVATTDAEPAAFDAVSSDAHAPPVPTVVATPDGSGGTDTKDLTVSPRWVFVPLLVLLALGVASLLRSGQADTGRVALQVVCVLATSGVLYAALSSQRRQVVGVTEVV